MVTFGKDSVEKHKFLASAELTDKIDVEIDHKDASNKYPIGWKIVSILHSLCTPFLCWYKTRQLSYPTEWINKKV